jgi:hypothetical protein
MRRITIILVLAAVAPTIQPARAAEANVALFWSQVALQAVRGGGGQFELQPTKLGPPMIARALAMVHTCMYDAWAAYDPVATGTRFGDALRRPADERTDANKREAVSYAAYRALADVMPPAEPLFRGALSSLGYSSANTTTDTTTPAGVGNVSCRAVLDYRHRDGANQLGDEPGGSGQPYSDYTGYQAVNAPMDPQDPFDPASVIDPNRWQPLRYTDRTGVYAAQTYIGPYWNHVAPFALTTAGELRSPSGPARHGDTGFLIQALQLLVTSATLTDEQKAIAEYFADGPNSELPPGHWVLFAQYVSGRDGHTLDEDVKMFFALTNAVFDAGIAAWDNKNVYDSVRPITAIRYLFHGLPVLAWGGPGRGTQLIDGGTWHPYQPSWFPTPPFPEYSSGHSAFSAAGAEILKLFTGSDAFGASATIRAGSSFVEPGITPARDVTLSWSTFSEAADQAGMSRRYGGIHFEQGDLDARAAGRQVARKTWDRCLALWSGDGPSPLH